jgi:hypothetical protein
MAGKQTSKRHTGQRKVLTTRYKDTCRKCLYDSNPCKVSYNVDPCYDGLDDTIMPVGSRQCVYCGFLDIPKNPIRGETVHKYGRANYR